MEHKNWEHSAIDTYLRHPIGSTLEFIRQELRQRQNVEKVMEHVTCLVALPNRMKRMLCVREEKGYALYLDTIKIAYRQTTTWSFEDLVDNKRIRAYNTDLVSYEKEAIEAILLLQSYLKQDEREEIPLEFFARCSSDLERISYCYIIMNLVHQTSIDSSMITTLLEATDDSDHCNNVAQLWSRSVSLSHAKAALESTQLGSPYEDYDGAVPDMKDLWSPFYKNRRKALQTYSELFSDL